MEGAMGLWVLLVGLSAWAQDDGVHRVWYGAPEVLARLAGSHAPWEVDRAEGWAVLQLSAEEVDALRAEGLRIEPFEVVAPPVPTMSAGAAPERATIADDVPQRKQAESAGDVPEELELLGYVDEAQAGGIEGSHCYGTVDELEARMRAAAAAHPDLVRLVDIGDSWEKEAGLGGHDLWALELGAPWSTRRPALVVTAGVHAREWAPVEVALRFAEQLVAGWGTDPVATQLLQDREIRVIPLVNPDGRVRAQTRLLWRKNADDAHCGGSDARGVDLNRNMPYRWGCCGGSSDDACSEVFRGAQPGSEPEARAVRDYLTAVFPDQRGPGDDALVADDATGVFIDLHSYSRLVLWPWGAGGPPPNEAGLRTLGRRLARFTGYYPQQLAELYPNDGTLTDFAYGELGVAAYTIELGDAFFESCDVFEQDLLPRNLDALRYAAAVADAPYVVPSGPVVTEITAVATRRRGKPVEVRAVVDDAAFSDANGAEPAHEIVAVELAYVPPELVDPADPTRGRVGLVRGADGAWTGSVPYPPFLEQALLYVRARDAAGVWGPPRAALVAPGKR